MNRVGGWDFFSTSSRVSKKRRGGGCLRGRDIAENHGVVSREKAVQTGGAVSVPDGEKI